MEYPQRKHARYRWHDYNGGVYFVTICVKDKEHLFGHIKDNTIYYTEIGETAVRQIYEISSHWGCATVISSVVMPNHVHMILQIDEIDSTGNSVQTATPSDSQPSLATPRRGPTLGGFHSVLAVVVGGYKAGVKRYANSKGIKFSWQSGFHDHIIRDPDNYEKISNYIANNILNWSHDCYFG